MEILIAEYNDLQSILELQYLAYQSEAKLLNNYEIPPLKQTLSEIQDEYASGVVLKVIDDSGEIVGSVRAYREHETVHIGKLIVHPDHQRKGIGTALLREIETVCLCSRYELFTSDKSQNNIRLYQKCGYQCYREQEVTPDLRFVYLEKTIGADTILAQNKQSWDAMADSWFGTTALPTYGCYIPTEEDIRLFPNLNGLKVLDIGCGSGHSLKWCGDNGATELWGLDMSTKQIENASRFLIESGYSPKLFNAPMESDCGLPKGYFDVVYSVYAIGWTVDLQTTFTNIASYLKKGGVFIFSWDHPFMHCVDIQEDKVVFEGSYHSDETFSYIQRGNPVTIINRKMSTYINTLSKVGLMVEQLIEESDKETLMQSVEFSSDYYSKYKAQKFPLSFIIKARKR